MSGPRGERDLCKNKNPWQSPFKLIKKNKYANEKKSKLKKKSELKKKQKKNNQVPAEVRTRRKWDAIALNNEPLKHRLSGDQIYNI